MTITKEQCFEQLLLGKAVKSEGWLEHIRVEALERARALNFPSARHDDWRFTDLSALYLHDFHPVVAFARLNQDDIGEFVIPGAIRLVFVDGCFAAELSDLAQAGTGVTVASLVERLGDRKVEENFGRHAPYKQDAFAALNTNFFEDGAWIHIDGEATAPIHILHVATRREAASAIYPRCMVVMEPSSRATVVEDYVGLPLSKSPSLRSPPPQAGERANESLREFTLNDGIYFSNAVTEVVLKEHARLQHVRVQREGKNAFHIGHCSVEAARNSVYAATSVALGARVSRHTLHVVQQGEGAEMHLDGLALIAGRQIADTHTLINHAAPGGRSVQLHKCIAGGSAHAVFSGKVIVQEGAVGTDSAQSSRNLLLSGKARIDTQPQLEIFNDDVKCKHGATVGQINADALFFLRSRGFSEERARNLLTHAFAAEIIARIPVPILVETLSSTILERMGGGLNA
ncbi:MAG: Fe-S cluster assembly protein SufD [Betaproteobacteria bacterium RBG_16_56_24]|nr:MAG: Fe-S cluster assembly protein SufD [Betaproteobacteria bacterium RBG_16_56_24]